MYKLQSSTVELIANFQSNPETDSEFVEACVESYAQESEEFRFGFASAFHWVYEKLNETIAVNQLSHKKILRLQKEVKNLTIGAVIAYHQSSQLGGFDKKSCRVLQAHTIKALVNLQQEADPVFAAQTEDTSALTGETEGYVMGFTSGFFHMHFSFENYVNSRRAPALISEPKIAELNRQILQLASAAATVYQQNWQALQN